MLNAFGFYQVELKKKRTRIKILPPIGVKRVVQSVAKGKQNDPLQKIIKKLDARKGVGENRAQYDPNVHQLKSSNAIHNILHENKEEATENLENLPRTPFELPQFIRIIRDYQEQLKQKHQEGNASILESADYQLLEDFKIVMELNNNLQKSSIELLIPDIQGIARKSLNNYGLGIQLIVNQKPGQVSKVLTPKDQYMEMVKKNPNLQSLKDILDLDLEY